METSIQPMSLGDIFDKTFKLLGKTWKRTIISSAIVVIPAAFLLGLGWQNFFSLVSSLDTTRHMTDAEGREFLQQLLTIVPLMSIGALAILIGSLIGNLTSTIIACRQFEHGEEISWGEAMGIAFREKFLRALGQGIVEGFAIVGIMLVPYLMIIVGATTDSKVLAVVGGLLFLPVIPLVVYLAVRWMFSQTIIANENVGVMESMRRSTLLVKGQWWRILGISLLMSIVISFAISLITTPIQFGAMWGFWKVYFNMFSHLGDRELSDRYAREMLQALSSVGWGMAVLVAVQSILSMIANPIYTVVFYYDQRARRNEFAVNQIGTGDSLS